MKKKLLAFPDPFERRQDKLIDEFAGAMLHRLRSQDQWLNWKPTEDEMLWALSKAWVEMRKAKASGDKRMVQELSADLANLALKCFNCYGK